MIWLILLCVWLWLWGFIAVLSLVHDEDKNKYLRWDVILTIAWWPITFTGFVIITFLIDGYRYLKKVKEDKDA